MLFQYAQNELHTLRDCLRFAVSQFTAAKLFFGHGSETAWDEAVYLAQHTLKLPMDQLEPFLDARLLQREKIILLNIYERRVNERLPAAYLTKEAWLAGHAFYVDERVIVPRSFIAELLSEHLYPWLQHSDSVHNILDLCTGSGCLAILAALNFEDAQVDAVDISPDALAVARQNVRDYDLNDRVTLLESDAFSALQGKRYDLIISNPPYVNQASMQTLPAEYMQEPELALASGADGLDFTRRLLAEARQYLNPEGVLVVEIGHNREVLEAAYPHLPFTWLETSAGDEYVFMLRQEEL